MLCTLLLTALFAAQGQSPRVRQYLSLAEATLRHPVTHEELDAALLSPEGVSTIRDFFERSIEGGLVANGNFVTPELGGEAMLDRGKLVLVPYPDPAHPLVREMVELENEPSRLLARLQSSAEGHRLLSATGGLHALLYQMASTEPTEAQRRLLRKVVDGAVATHFKTWTTDPAVQARMIETTEWRGRYVGFWHIHPPRFRGGELAEGIEPSVPDMRHAVELGQFLTVVFQPEGFDAYDLSGLAAARAVDLRRARVIRYRDAAWRDRFAVIVNARLSGVEN